MNDWSGGSCYYWAGSHYRMFDGTVLSVPQGCGHVLVSEQRDNIFRIFTRLGQFSVILGKNYQLSH